MNLLIPMVISEQRMQKTCVIFSSKNSIKFYFIHKANKLIWLKFVCLDVMRISLIMTL